MPGHEGQGQLVVPLQTAESTIRGQHGSSFHLLGARTGERGPPCLDCLADASNQAISMLTVSNSCVVLGLVLLLMMPLSPPPYYEARDSSRGYKSAAACNMVGPRPPHDRSAGVQTCGSDDKIGVQAWEKPVQSSQPSNELLFEVLFMFDASKGWSKGGQCLVSSRARNKGGVKAPYHVH